MCLRDVSLTTFPRSPRDNKDVYFNQKIPSGSSATAPRIIRGDGLFQLKLKEIMDLGKQGSYPEHNPTVMLSQSITD